MSDAELYAKYAASVAPLSTTEPPGRWRVKEMAAHNDETYSNPRLPWPGQRKGEVQ